MTHASDHGRAQSASDIRRDGWIDRLLPAPARPYARLMRLDRPIGTWLLLFPCVLLGMTLLAMNFVGEGLREALDPKRARR